MFETDNETEPIYPWPGHPTTTATIHHLRCCRPHRYICPSPSPTARPYFACPVSFSQRCYPVMNLLQSFNSIQTWQHVILLMLSLGLHIPFPCRFHTSTSMCMVDDGHITDIIHNITKALSPHLCALFGFWLGAPPLHSSTMHETEKH